MTLADTLSAQDLQRVVPLLQSQASTNLLLSR